MHGFTSTMTVRLENGVLVAADSVGIEQRIGVLHKPMKVQVVHT